MENSVGQFSSGGFLKWGYPKSSILTRFSIINHPFWGTSIYWKPHLETWRGCDVCIITYLYEKNISEALGVGHGHGSNISRLCHQSPRGTKWGPWGTPHIFFTPQVETKPNIANLRYPGKGVYVPVCHRIKKCPGYPGFTKILPQPVPFKPNQSFYMSIVCEEIYMSFGKTSVFPQN